MQRPGAFGPSRGTRASPGGFLVWGELAGEERGRRAYRHPGAPAATSDSTSDLLEVQRRARAGQ